MNFDTLSRTAVKDLPTLLHVLSIVRAHGYQPYHTPRYNASRALMEAEKRAKAAPGKTRDQQTTNIFLQSAQSTSSFTSSSTSSSADSLEILFRNATYRNNLWKLMSRTATLQSQRFLRRFRSAPLCYGLGLRYSQDFLFHLDLSLPGGRPAAYHNPDR
jgi:hypothetical protein